MSGIINMLNSIPGPVWGVFGAVAGAALTSITNLISNFGNNKRLALQLAHDAREKNIDRMNVLRREIYLAAIEEMTKASSYFGSIPHKDFNDQNVSVGLSGLYIAAAKLALVAPPGTQEAVDTLGVEYWELTQKVMLRLPPMQLLKAEINLCSTMYDQTMAEVKRIINSMNHLRESGSVDERAMYGLKSSFDFLSEQAAEQAKKRSDANFRFNKLCDDYNKELMSDMMPLALLQAKVVIAIRQDLGIETDVPRMMAHTKQQWSKVSAAVEELFSE